MAVTLTIENGTIVPNANSFASVDDFKTFCDNRGYAYGAATDDQIGAALVIAGDYLNNEERFWWRGQRVSDAQSMCYPRSGVLVLYGTGVPLADDVVPNAVKNAQCYLAWKQFSGVDIQPDLERGGAISTVSAGGVSVTFQPNALKDTDFQTAQGLVQPYLRKTYYVIFPTLVSDARGYDKVSNNGSSDGVQNRPGSEDTENEAI